jgi:hypothetical protein
MAALFLGSCDVGKVPTDRKNFLLPYHRDGLLIGKVSFRDDDRTKWRSFREGEGFEVKQLQDFLFNAGFMTKKYNSGVFDYATQASVRLFQEYIRTIDKDGDKEMLPDGIVGSVTMSHINRWIQEGKECDWGPASASNPSQEYTNWMKLLKDAKAHY